MGDRIQAMHSMVRVVLFVILAWVAVSGWVLYSLWEAWHIDTRNLMVRIQKLEMEIDECTSQHQTSEPKSH